MLRLIPILFVTLPLAAAPVPKGATPRKLPPNTNTLLKAHTGKLKYESSTQYTGWEIAKLFDGTDTTSWFSASGDSPMGGTTPWVMVTFPENVTVNRVTVLGNREPSYPTGYFIIEGRVELLDEKGKTIVGIGLNGEGDKRDFDHEPVQPVKAVRAIRFTCLKDEKQNNCIALSEMQVE